MFLVAPHAVVRATTPDAPGRANWPTQGKNRTKRVRFDGLVCALLLLRACLASSAPAILVLPPFLAHDPSVFHRRFPTRFPPGAFILYRYDCVSCVAGSAPSFFSFQNAAFSFRARHSIWNPPGVCRIMLVARSAVGGPFVLRGLHLNNVQA